MGQYLAQLFQYVLDFGYNTAKGSHYMVLSDIEEQQVTWEDLNHINLIRTQYSHKFIVHSPGKASIAPGSNISKNNVQNSNSKPCRKFNSGVCQFEGHQTFNGLTYKHNCNFC